MPMQSSRIATTRLVAEEALYRARLASGAGGGGAGGAGGIVVVTPATSPYQVKPTDTLIEANDAAGQVTVTMTVSPAAGERHTVKKLTTNGTPVIVQAGPNLIESGINAGNFATGNTQVSGQGALVTWEWDGTQWVIIG